MKPEINRLVFSCEFLTPQSILKKNVVQFIAETGIYFSLRVQPSDLSMDAFLEMMQAFRDNGIEDHFVPWPMIELEDGYYPNTKTVDKFAPIMKANCEWYQDHDFQIPPYMLIDLEPSMSAEAIAGFKAHIDNQDPELSENNEQKKKKSDIMSFVGKLIDDIDANVDLDQFQIASDKFGNIQSMMHDYGTKAIAVAIPYVYDDIYDNQLLIQNYLTTPVTNVDWDMVNFMTFETGFVRDTKNIINDEEYRHLLFNYGQDWVQHWGAEKASITLGITSYGTETIHQVHIDPDDYRLEASACLAADIKDIGIYALEGILSLKNPKDWIETVMQAKASDFEVNPEKLEFAKHVRRIFQTIDFLSPTLQYLVKSGKVMDIIQALTKKH